MFKRLFFLALIVAVTHTATLHGPDVRARLTNFYNEHIAEKPPSPLAKMLLELLADPDNWTLDYGDHLILKGGLFEVSDNQDVKAEPYHVWFQVDGHYRANLFTDAERRRIFEACRTCKGALKSRQAQALADRIAAAAPKPANAATVRTTQCFPAPAAPPFIMPTPAQAGVALPAPQAGAPGASRKPLEAEGKLDPNAKETQCPDSERMPCARSLRPGVGPRQ